MVMKEILERRSVRKYTDKPVTDDEIRKILEAGRLAPSWINVQPWQFIVVKNPKTKELLYEAAGNQNHVKTASAVICCIADLSAWEKKSFEKVMEQQGKNEAVRNFILSSPALNPTIAGQYETLLRTVEQVTYAVSYMTLEAEELGVKCCVVGAMANEVTKSDTELSEKVKDVLGLNDKQILITILTLGHSDANTDTVKHRKAFEDVVSLEKLGNKF